MNVLDILEQRGFIEQVTHNQELRDYLGGESVSCYIGFDPTAASLHVGSLVPIMALAHMHGALLEGIATDYRPPIDAIGRRAQELQQETQTLIAQRPSRVLESNLAAQQLTIEAAGRYAEYLKGQQHQVEASRQRLAQDIAVAQNTYETVKMSGDLVAMMQDSRQLLDSLFRLQVPPLRAFENLEMKREFQRLTSALRQESA